MSLRKTSSRLINVSGAEFRWTFADLGDVDEVTVQSASGRGAKLVVLFDAVFVRDGEILRRAAGATPGFVARAIEFALANGWNPNVSGAGVRIRARDGTFKVLV